MTAAPAASQNPAVCGFRFCGNCWWAAGSQADCGVLTSLQRQGDRRGWARSHGVDAENRDFSSVFEPFGIAEAFSESKCLCLNFEVRVVRSIEFREIELSSTLRLQQQADASKRRPVRVSGPCFLSVSRVSRLSNSPHRDLSPIIGANPQGAVFSISRSNSRHSRYLLEPGL